MEKLPVRMFTSITPYAKQWVMDVYPWLYKNQSYLSWDYGIIDLGSLYWVYDSERQKFYATLPNACAALEYSGKGNPNSFISNGYANMWEDPASLYDNEVDKAYVWNSYYFSGDKQIFVRDTSYSDAAAFKTAMSGVYFIYELDKNQFMTVDDLDKLNWTADTVTRPADSKQITSWYADTKGVKVVDYDVIPDIRLMGYESDTLRSVDYGGYMQVKDKLVGGADANSRVWIYNSRYESYGRSEMQETLKGKKMQFQIEDGWVKVDLGDLDWSEASGYDHQFRAAATGAEVGDDAEYTNIVANGYETLPWSYYNWHDVNGIALGQEGGMIWLKDMTAENASALKAKLKGLYAIYKTASDIRGATPTPAPKKRTKSSAKPKN